MELEEEVSKELKKFPFDIQVLSFNRPEYLEQCLLGLQSQTLFLDPRKVYFWQDGYLGSKDEFLGLPDNTNVSISLIKKYFPESPLNISPKNLGIGLIYKKSEENAFMTNQNDWSVFIEEDNVLQDFYFDVVSQLISRVDKFEDIVQVDAFGDFRSNFQSDYYMSFHSWAFALRSSHYFERKEFLSSYEDILEKSSYFRRDANEISSFIRDMGSYPFGTSQDFVKRVLMQKFRRLSITTNFPCATNVGINGEHFNPEIYKRLGYEDQNPVLEIKHLPPISEKTLKELMWHQIGYLQSTLGVEVSLIHNQRDGVIAERDGVIAERDGVIAERERSAGEANAARAVALGERDAAFAVRDAAVEERNSAVAAAIAVRDAAVEERNSAVSAANAVRDAAVEERNSAVAERNAIVNSTIWKIFKPYRAIIKLIKSR